LRFSKKPSPGRVKEKKLYIQNLDTSW